MNPFGKTNIELLRDYSRVYKAGFEKQKFYYYYYFEKEVLKLDFC